MGLDMRIIEFIHENMHNPFLDRAMPFFSRLGNEGLIWIVMALILLAGRKYRQTGFMIISAILLGAVLGEVVLKNVFQRARPFMEVPHFELLIKVPRTRYSFPSGHTTSSFAAAGTVLRTTDNRLLKGAVLTLAVLIAFSRVYLLVHYPTDILGGIVLGLLSSYIVHRWFSNRGSSAGTKVL